MRYIDVDKLKEVFDEHEDDYGYLHGYWEEFIDNAPTADVRENVRAEWIAVVDKTEMYDKEGVKTWGTLFQCNKCGFVLNAVEGHIGQYNFCPNCGVDMRPISALSENAEIDSNSKRGE